MNKTTVPNKVHFRELMDMAWNLSVKMGTYEDDYMDKGVYKASEKVHALMKKWKHNREICNYGLMYGTFEGDNEYYDECECE